MTADEYQDPNEDLILAIDPLDSDRLAYVGSDPVNSIDEDGHRKLFWDQTAASEGNSSYKAHHHAHTTNGRAGYCSRGYYWSSWADGGEGACLPISNDSAVATDDLYYVTVIPDGVLAKIGLRAAAKESATVARWRYMKYLIKRLHVGERGSTGGPRITIEELRRLNPDERARALSEVLGRKHDPKRAEEFNKLWSKLSKGEKKQLRGKIKKPSKKATGGRHQ